MRRTRLFQIVTGVTIVLAAGCSRGDDASPPEQPRPAAVGTGGAGANLNSDDEFVHDVAMKNMGTIELSRLALVKTASPEIKSFARLIIGGHEIAGDKLKGVLSGQTIDWPARVDDKYTRTAERLKNANAVDFDREYVAAMIDSHVDLAAKLESRLDVQSLADWKAAAAARTQSREMPDPRGVMGDLKVRPHKSDSEITAKINQWAADTYPVAQKHLDTARMLESATKKRSSD
jgi:predicted outer membrane protein